MIGRIAERSPFQVLARGAKYLPKESWPFYEGPTSREFPLWGPTSGPTSRRRARLTFHPSKLPRSSPQKARKKKSNFHSPCMIIYRIIFHYSENDLFQILAPATAHARVVLLKIIRFVFRILGPICASNIWKCYHCRRYDVLPSAQITTF